MEYSKRTGPTFLRDTCPLASLSGSQSSVEAAVQYESFAFLTIILKDLTSCRELEEGLEEAMASD